MSELYTSLSRLKMAMNGGVLPPMTPLTPEAKQYIDPAFTIGMGALEEGDRGLRCPVRGCGEYFHRLAVHLNSAHKSIGGASGLKRALSIPPKAGLVSRRVREMYSHRAADLRRDGKLRSHPSRHEPRSRERVARCAESRRASSASMGTRNLRNVCDAQIVSRITDLAHKLGRTPSWNDVPRDLSHWAVKVYGSWNRAVAEAGLRARKIGHTKDDIYDAMEAWVERHGRLPNATELDSPERTPLVPGRVTILKALGVTSWDQAIEHLRFVVQVPSKSA